MGAKKSQICLSSMLLQSLVLLPLILVLRFHGQTIRENNICVNRHFILVHGGSGDVNTKIDNLLALQPDPRHPDWFA